VAEKDLTPFSVRLARPEDVPAVLALWSQARSSLAQTEDRPADVERLARDGALVVAVAPDGVVGTLIAAYDGWRGNMYRLVVRPHRRRHGIARRLIAAGEERLRQMGARRVTALVARDDEVVNRVWERAGYAADPNLGRWVRNL
jgi:ribosomal protein S18 acetylase RimI-like enzyme